MRIVGEIPHPVMKITIMHHNEKYTIQFEDRDVMQSIIVRESNKIDSLESLKSYVDENFVQIIHSSIQNIRKTWQNQLISQETEEDFETII